MLLDPESISKIYLIVQYSAFRNDTSDNQLRCSTAEPESK